MSSRDRMEQFEDEPLEQIDISATIDDMWKGLKRFWFLCLIIILACAGLMFAKAKFFYTPEYTASMTYTVTSGENNSTYTNQTVASELGKTMEYILTSKVLLTMVEEDLGVDEIPGEFSVSVMENSNLFTLSATSSDPQMAYDILQVLIADYPSVAQTVIGTTELELMDDSGVPGEASNVPDYKYQIELGALIGLAISFLMLLIYAMTRHTIQKEEDFKKYLNVECFGVIPRARFKRRGKKGSEKKELVLMNNQHAPAGFRESIRAVRRRLEGKIENYEKKEQERVASDVASGITSEGRTSGARVILVTSAIPGEGKSTVAANIAMALALKGKDVILADMDLRNPSLFKTFGRSGAKAGTVDVLSGKFQADQVLISYKRTSLRLLPGGKPINNTSRALSAENLKRFTDALRSEADYVILDTPPCAMLFDASIIAKYADHAVFVVRQDFARIDRVTEGILNLSESGVNICGCVLNQAQVGVTGSGYGRHYGYGRYGYGYGDKKYGYGYSGYGYGDEKKGEKTEQNSKSERGKR